MELNAGLNIHEKYGRWIVAVSGGPDSMALLHWLHARNIRITAAHVNYHHRLSANRDEMIVKDWCDSHDIPLIIADGTRADETGNFQAWARDFRYEFFKELTERYGAYGVICAHHQDDVLETWLMHKNRSSLQTSLMMERYSRVQGVDVLRPFLKVSKSQLQEYCDENQVPYGIDESNLSDLYSRNSIRHWVEKMKPEEKALLIDEMERENRHWNEKKKAFKNALMDENTLDLSKAEESDSVLWIQWLIRKCSGRQISKAFGKDLEEKLKTKKDVWLDEWLLSLQDSFLSMNRKRKLKPAVFSDMKQLETCDLALDENLGLRFEKKGKTIQSVQIEPDDFPVTIRPAKNGDVIEMKYGHKKLSDFFKDRKIPKYLREGWPVMENGRKEIIFVDGLGCSLSHYAKKANCFMVQYSLTNFNRRDSMYIPETPISKDIDRVLFSESQISVRCRELTSQIEKDYQDAGSVPMVVGLLKGSVPFMSELIKYFSAPIEIDFMSVSSYEGTVSTGDIKINKDMDLSCSGKDVLLVEDIVDTGRTLKKVKDLLYRKNARSVKIVSLLDKPGRRVVDIEADYVGFPVPDYFVVGYGLDYNQKYRNLPYIGILKSSVYE